MERDKIDHMVSALREARPDLDPAYLEVLGRIDRLALLHYAATQREFPRRVGVSSAEFEVLLALRLVAPAFQLTPTALANAVIMTSGGMTIRLDRLERAGLVQRQPDPGDRRGSLVLLTEAGHRLVDEHLADIAAREDRLLVALSPSERRQLAQLLRKLLLSDPIHAHDPHWPQWTAPEQVTNAGVPNRATPPSAAALPRATNGARRSG